MCMQIQDSSFFKCGLGFVEAGIKLVPIVIADLEILAGDFFTVDKGYGRPQVMQVVSLPVRPNEHGFHIMHLNL